MARCGETLRHGILGALAVLLSAASWTSAAADPDPAPTLQWIEGEIVVTQPAEAHATAVPETSWIAQWLSGGDGPAGPLGNFSLRTDRIEVTYTDHFHLAPAGPSTREGTLARPTEVFHDARVALQPHTDVRQELSARGAAEPNTVFAAQAWALSTTGPGDLFVATAGGHEVFQPPDRHVLLEADNASVVAPRAQEVYVYGFQVTIHHRDGTARYDTGVIGIDVMTGPNLGPRMMRAPHEGTLTLRMTAANLSVDSPRHLRVAAPAVALVGTVASPSADGRLRVADIAHEFGQSPLALDGAFLFRAADAPSEDAHALQLEGEGALAQTDAVLDEPTNDAAPMVSLALVGAIGGAIVLVAAARWLAPATVALYTRLTKGDVARSPVRQQLLQVIVAEPGIGMKAAAQRVGCGWGTVVYHVQVLRRMGHITTQRVGHERCLFENHGKYTGRYEAVGMVRQPQVRRLLETIQAAPGITQAELGQRVGLSQQWISRILARFRATGWVEGDGRTGQALRLTPLGSQALASPISATAT